MSRYSKRLLDFINENQDCEPDKLLLTHSGKHEFDVKLAVNTIEGRKRMLKKMPEWANREMIYPTSICTEQSSSYHTGLFKQKIFQNASVVADLTGGIGVDSYYASQVAERVVIFEKNKILAEAAGHNFKILKRNNIRVHNTEISQSNISDLLSKAFEGDTQKENRLVFVDPSRRGAEGQRSYSITDYEPNILDIKDTILKYSSRLLIKVSPMADITKTLNQLGGCSKVLVVSVYNECKELLFYIDINDYSLNTENVPIEAWNLTKSGNWQTLSFSIKEEKSTDIEFQNPSSGQFLYEPNTSIIKAGGFKITAKRFSLSKISVNSHLYLSDEYTADFQGRVFNILEIFNFDKRDIKKITNSYPKASVAVRNFPLSAQELRERLKIEEGDEFFLFGTHLPNNQRKIIICKKLDQLSIFSPFESNQIT